MCDIAYYYVSTYKNVLFESPDPTNITDWLPWVTRSHTKKRSVVVICAALFSDIFMDYFHYHRLPKNNTLRKWMTCIPVHFCHQLKKHGRLRATKHWRLRTRTWLAWLQFTCKSLRIKLKLFAPCVSHQSALWA